MSSILQSLFHSERAKATACDGWRGLTVPPDVTPRDLLGSCATRLGSTVTPCGDQLKVRTSPKATVHLHNDKQRL